jgi:broad-specificity NMP kinase
MRLIFLYGAPGTGKLTVGRELAKQTGFRLFHNHLTVDLAKTLFEFGTPAYLEYVRALRVDALTRAAKADIDMIFTFWYSRDSVAGLKLYQNVIDVHGIECIPVKLYCPPEVLHERVQSPERKGWKISSKEGIENALENTDLEFVLPQTRLILDTTKHTPEEAARVIHALIH